MASGRSAKSPATGVHGANRLASNSLLEAIVFGARVAADIAAPPRDESNGASRRESNLISDARSDFAVIEELRDLMSANVGVVRDGAGLARALGAIRRLTPASERRATQNMLTTALLIASAALRPTRKPRRAFPLGFSGAGPRARAPLATHA